MFDGIFLLNFFRLAQAIAKILLLLLLFLLDSFNFGNSINNEEALFQADDNHNNSLEAIIIFIKILTNQLTF